MKTARVRIRNVKFKSGLDVSVIYTDRDAIASRIGRVTASVLTAAQKEKSPIAGFVFMVWHEDGLSFCEQMCLESSAMPSLMIPDYVRNRLLQDRIERWTIDEINGNK